MGGAASAGRGATGGAAQQPAADASAPSAAAGPSPAAALKQAASSGGGGLSGVLAGSAFGASPDLNPKNNIAVCKNGLPPSCDQCQAGWQGANCDSCTASQACQASLGDSGATCNTGFDYTQCAASPAPACMRPVADLTRCM